MSNLVAISQSGSITCNYLVKEQQNHPDMLFLIAEISTAYKFIYESMNELKFYISIIY